jgi:hypothetical protein
MAPDSERDLGPDGDLLGAAWALIANAGEGDWTRESADWQQAAAAWRDRWHAWLDEHIHGAPSDEDRIRDAMTEAQAHPGRTITR